MYSEQGRYVINIYILYTYIYHAKSRLNTTVWGSLRSPNNINGERLDIDDVCQMSWLTHEMTLSTSNYNRSTRNLSTKLRLVSVDFIFNFQFIHLPRAIFVCHSSNLPYSSKIKSKFCSLVLVPRVCKIWNFPISSFPRTSVRKFPEVHIQSCTDSLCTKL